MSESEKVAVDLVGSVPPRANARNSGVTAAIRKAIDNMAPGDVARIGVPVYGSVATAINSGKLSGVSPKDVRAFVRTTDPELGRVDKANKGWLYLEKLAPQSDQ